MGKSCCVPGCKSGVKVPSHKFPKDIERCSQWIHSLKLDQLTNYCAQDLQRYKVCHKHFSETDYSCSLHCRKLIKTAIPVMVADTIDNNLHLQNEQSQQVSEDIEQNQVPKISGQDTESLIDSEDIEQNQVPTISGQETESVVDSQNDFIQNDNNNDNDNGQRNTEKSSRRSKHVRPNLRNVTRVRHLSPIAKSLYDITIKLRRRNRYLKRLVKDSRAKNNIKSIFFKRTTSTTHVQEQFVNMILRNNDVPPQVCCACDDKV